MERGTDPKRSSARTALAVVVLGARVHPDGSPSAALVRRVRAGVSLLAGGAADGALLVMSGGHGKGHRPPLPTEAAVMADLARRAGLTDAVPIRLEDRSRTTLENARAVTDMLAPLAPERVLVVTDRTHLPRALMCFRAARRVCRVGWRIEGHGVPAGNRAEATRAGAREAIARVLYRIRLLRGAMLAAVPPGRHDGRPGQVPAPPPGEPKA